MQQIGGKVIGKLYVCIYTSFFPQRLMEYPGIIHVISRFSALGDKGSRAKLRVCMDVFSSTIQGGLLPLASRVFKQSDGNLKGERAGVCGTAPAVPVQSTGYTSLPSHLLSLRRSSVRLYLVETQNHSLTDDSQGTGGRHSPIVPRTRSPPLNRLCRNVSICPQLRDLLCQSC